MPKYRQKSISQVSASFSPFTSFQYMFYLQELQDPQGNFLADRSRYSAKLGRWIEPTLVVPSRPFAARAFGVLDSEAAYKPVAVLKQRFGRG
ncbi:MAG: hypothetical protein U1E67_08635 [Hyphomicrobiales bacterium]